MPVISALHACQIFSPPSTPLPRVSLDIFSYYSADVQQSQAFNRSRCHARHPKPRPLITPPPTRFGSRCVPCFGVLSPQVPCTRTHLDPKSGWSSRLSD